MTNSAVSFTNRINVDVLWDTLYTLTDEDVITVSKIHTQKSPGYENIEQFSIYTCDVNALSHVEVIANFFPASIAKLSS